MELFRYWLGRSLLHAGILVLPDGRVKKEITQILGVWGRMVLKKLANPGESA